ncbi:Rha family transcriptional regulator [Enterococcus sp. 5H]|uniref:Rha family transcriptional regulator n=1 Tax=Enterococcus sp. 5H TaxID=1229490 RepID=UPI0023029459|nr:Rha family transcriptional regulator [Enterococcus sp. 5H]MDA9472286.1 Antirepressor [Enterococcus sp. 5H]
MEQLQQTISSREVAKMVDRNHADVMRDIKKIVSHLAESKIALGDYFIDSTYLDANNQERPCYDLTKKGCELYSTRMTGAKGTQFAVAYIERFNQMENHLKLERPQQQDDLVIKQMNAEARLKNANSRQAKLFAELAKDAPTEVNKAILQDKAVEVLTGEKLLEMPKLKQKMFDAEQIAKKLGILSKNNESHKTAVSQLIQEYIVLEEDEFDYFPGATNSWSGDVTKYRESVIQKVVGWLEENNYPSVIAGSTKNYHVKYEF